MDLKLILQTISTVLIIITSICYAYQFVYLFIPLLSKKRITKSDKLNRYAVLIPARNEEKVLPNLIESIQQQDYPAELITIYVIADNCTDNTAKVAFDCGAKVFTRFSTEQVGKGYALNYLLREIDKSDGLESFDAFLVFDADNLLQRDYIRQINHLYADGYDAFCGYRNTKNFGSNWISAGYGVWYLHDSTHLNRSRMAVGASCMVNGTGFGFSREVLRKCGQWEFFTLTEDIEFSVWCAANGIKIGYCHDAILYDEQPITFPQSWRQRTRWVQGGIQILFKRSKELFRGMVKGGWRSYSCFEFATLSAWGYILGILSGITASAATIVNYGVDAFLISLLFALISSYLSLLAVGAWTVLTEWNRIRAKTRHKILGVFAFPMYMLTFIPIAIFAPFCKFQWTPVDHNVDVSENDMLPK